MDNPGNTGNLDPHAAHLVSAFESMMERIGKAVKRQPQKDQEQKPSFGSKAVKAYPRLRWFDRGGR